MKVSKQKLKHDFVPSPQTSFDKLRSSLLKISWEGLFDLLLGVLVNYGYELFIELAPAHRACLISNLALPLALQAEQVVARGAHRFCYNFQADGTFEVGLRFLLGLLLFV